MKSFVAWSLSAAMALTAVPLWAQGGRAGAGQRNPTGSVLEISADALSIQPMARGNRQRGGAGGGGAGAADATPQKFALTDKSLYAEMSAGQLADVTKDLLAVIVTDGNETNPTARALAVYKPADGKQEQGAKIVRAAVMPLMLRAMLGARQGGGAAGGAAQRPTFVAGVVTSVGNGQLVLKTREKDVTVTLPDRAAVMKIDDKTHDDIVKGRNVVVVPSADGDPKTAEVVLQLPKVGRGGAAGGAPNRPNKNKK